MTGMRSELRNSALLLLLSAAVAACTPSESKTVSDEPTKDYPARLTMTKASATELNAPAIITPQPEGAVWQTGAQGGLAFGVPGATPLVTFACANEPNGGATLNITRYAATDPGAQALFALIGNGRIARLPVDASAEGKGQIWRGAIPADDAQLDVLKGGNSIEATVPGGGSIKLTASGLPGQLLESCRRANHLVA